MISPSRGSRRAKAVFVTLLVITAAVGIASWDRLHALIPALSTGERDALVPMRVVQEPLIVPRSAETALERARALLESGRAYDALRAVDLVRPTDPLRDDADRLKAAIQRELLAFHTLPGSPDLFSNEPGAARGDGVPAGEAAAAGPSGPVTKQ
jgi:hypothetical protein